MPSRQVVLQQSKNFTSRAAIHIASEELLVSDRERVDRSATRKEKQARVELADPSPTQPTRSIAKEHVSGCPKMDYEERQKQSPPVDALLSHAEACGRQVGHFERIVFFTVTHADRPREGRPATPRGKPTASPVPGSGLWRHRIEHTTNEDGSLRRIRLFPR